MQLNINNLKQLLKLPLPGEIVQLQMAPTNRPNLKIEDLKESDYKKSAVMVVICKDEANDFFIPLIERQTYNGTHSGQISLPGGKFDTNDVNLEATAKRECFEEIGIQSYEILGELTQLYIPVSGFLVQPFLGFCTENNLIFNIDTREVSAIIKLKISDLLNDNFIQFGNLSPDADLKHSYFEIEKYKIWGATAMILNEVKTLIRKSVDC